MLAGTIGNYPVVMHLHKAGHTYNGYYYYQSTQQPLPIMGEDTSVAGTVTLMVTSGGAKEGEFFQFTLIGGAAKGNWQLDDHQKTLPFIAKEQVSQTAFQYLNHKAAQPLKASMPNSPRVSYDAAIVWPTGGNGVGTAIRKRLVQFVGSGNQGGEAAALMQQAQSNLFAAYRKEFGQTKEEELKEMPAAFTNDQSQRALVAYSGKAFLSLSLFTYAYTGGAHGNYGTQFQSFNLASGKALQVKDVLNPAGIKALSKLLAAAFREREGLSAATPLTEGGLFENKLKTTDNFFVTGKGLGFNYQPYEIGPYAMGEIILYLPYARIRNYLQPGFANALKKN
ncbi:protein of unknown function [Cnuella takakiae]|uniref:DUF3298 domain-containing protein n=1 Tax=Cnuella takakiae TaxID=1302690 RepID=A0A1M4YBG2_9BACT|nr:DUF3298 and DUF4163 domain-containing protein [Cnuella takakiae]SHF03075.1 protein of unknown function [Cnuella takakiae]